MRRDDARPDRSSTDRAGGGDVPAPGGPAAGADTADGPAQPGPAPGTAGAGGTGGTGGAGGASDAGTDAASFGAQDADTRARRIARALVSDIVAYHSDRLPEDADAAAVRQAYRDEILKSWEEYVAQVGREMAEGTAHFRNALNEILAGGEAVF